MVTRLAGRLVAAGHVTRGSEPGHPRVVTLACRYLSGSGQPGRGLAAAGTVAFPLAAPACRPQAGEPPRCASLQKQPGEGYGTISCSLVSVWPILPADLRHAPAFPAPAERTSRGDVHCPGQRPAGDGLPRLLRIRQASRVPEC